MNPVLIAQFLGFITEGIKAAPALIAEFNAIKAAGTATPDQLDAIQAQIEAMDAARLTSWAEAAAALDAAAQR